MVSLNLAHPVQCESKKITPCGLRFSDTFPQTVENFKSIFIHLLHAPSPIYDRLQMFIQLSQILTKLCHIKRDYKIIILSSHNNMRKKSTLGRNARVQMFAKVVDSFVDRCLWQVIPDLLLL